MTGEPSKPDEDAICADFASALENCLPDDATITEEDATLAIAYRAWGKDRMVGELTAKQLVTQFNLQAFVTLARQWNKAGTQHNGISPGDWLIAEGELFRAVMQREVTALAMPRTAEFEVLLEKLNGSFFGFVADNELDQVRIRDVSADQLSRLVRNGLLNEKQALQVYLASMQSRHGIDFLMKLAVAALEKIRNGDNSHVDFHHDFAASKIIESLNLEPFLSTEKVGVETVQSRCPKCGEWHDYDLKPEAADGFGDDACYVVDCPDCEKTFGINCYGKVTRDWSVESRCPKCGERHDYDLHPSDGWPYPGGEAWFINCPSCQDYFGVSQDGKVVRQYNIRVACAHCDHGFLITEPAVDPFKICCPECGQETICLSSYEFSVEKGEIPDKWRRDYDDMPNLSVPDDYFPVYWDDVPLSTLQMLCQWLVGHREKVQPEIFDWLLPALKTTEYKADLKARIAKISDKEVPQELEANLQNATTKEALEELQQKITYYEKFISGGLEFN